MLPDTSTCVADHKDKLSKDSVIDYVRESDEESVPISCDEQALRAFANANMLPGMENLPEFLIRKCRACFIKTR